MLYLVALVILLCAPLAWVKYVINKHSAQLENIIPGTGGELARHLADRHGLTLVRVEQSAKDDNHYSPAENTVRLSPDVYSGKSLKAIAVAAHEIGHAIQFNRNESVVSMSEKYLNKAMKFKRAGIYILMATPVLTVFMPFLAIPTTILGGAIMLVSVLIHIAILPLEYDASFNKALPILDKGEYVPKMYLPAIRQILRACALTYLAAGNFRLQNYQLEIRTIFRSAIL